MHRSPKGREQLVEERTARREGELDRRTADALLRQMEWVNQRVAGTTTGQLSSPVNTPLHMADYEQLKRLHKGTLPPAYERYFKREIDVEKAAASQKRDDQATAAVAEKSTFATQPVENVSRDGFFGVADHTDASIAPLARRSQSIPAVIHGDGEAVKAHNGSTINIRLLEDTQLSVGGKPVTVPAHTLLTGTCSIGTDRVNIAVTTLRMGTSLFPVSLRVYDVDAHPGLWVPKLADKNRLAQSAASSAGQAVSSPYYFIPQGSFGQQVGSQLAMQATNTAFQGVRSLLQSKLAAVQVTVKPNYRILLREEQRDARLGN
jgi:conjugative transposon TraM protein